MNEDGDIYSHQRHMERLNRMEDVIQSMITLVHEQSKAMLQIIRESRAEIQDLITLQKEQRIDIMALFTANRELREEFRKHFEKS